MMIQKIQRHSNLPLKSDESLIEKFFPVEKLNKIATVQGNSRMPIYQIHKWWGRRLGSVFRAILISSFLKPKSDTIFWDYYYNGFSLNKKVIYDPFMGGGTTIIEGLRLGCRVIGSDINPVAWFVTKKEIEPLDIKKADAYFSILNKKLGKKIQNFYKTKCPKGHKASIRYCFWIRRIRCRNCCKVNNLFGNFIIRNTDSERIIICHKCFDVFSTKSKQKIIKCKYKHRINLESVPVRKGLFTCLQCGIQERVVEAAKRDQQFHEPLMMCIEYQCDKCGVGYKVPSKSDLALFQHTKNEFKHKKDELEFPSQKIILNGIDQRPLSHSFTHFHLLFTPRQLLCLSLLLKEIKSISDENIREFFLLTLSASLETNNNLCKYESNYGKISTLFSLPAYHIPERFAENNLWGSGRGTFPRNYEKLLRGKKYSSNPFERIYNIRSPGSPLGSKRKSVGMNINTEVDTNDFNFQSPWRARIECRNSQCAEFLPDRSVDAVITDPPYFQTIPYSDLADFFYVWLRLGLRNRYPWFTPKSSQSKGEVIAHHDSGADSDKFVQALVRVFKEAKRVLKDDGIMVFTFHHSKRWAWVGLKKALNESGFYVTATPIIRSEGNTGYRKGNAIAYDVCVVCRKVEGKILSRIESPISIKSYINDAKALKALDSEISSSEILTIIMCKYLTADKEIAQRILEDCPLLVTKIKHCIRTN